jgi:hypothetical protein
VECPEEDILVFDVEILVKEGHYPTLATALSPTNWYVLITVIYENPVFIKLVCFYSV